jgi:hypothetical protein
MDITAFEVLTIAVTADLGSTPLTHSLLHHDRSRHVIQEI